MRANLIDSLRRFVAKTPSSDPFDQKLAKRFAKIPRIRKTASRLLASIDAKGKPLAAKVELTKTVGLSKLTMFVPHRHVSHSKLPAQGVMTTSTYDLVLSGVTCDASSDDDADGDEPIVLTTWAVANGDDIGVDTVSVPADGTLTGLKVGGVKKQKQEIYDGAGVEGLLVTAMVEDDDGSAATARDDYELLMGMALSMTDVIDGDPLTKLEFAIGYTHDILAAANPERWGGNSIVTTRIGKDQLPDLWATEADKTGTVSWKLRQDHETGGGKYGVLFDVPAPKPPQTGKLVVRMLELADLDPNTKHTRQMYANVSIRDEYARKDFDSSKTPKTLDWQVSRVVTPGTVKVSVELAEYIACGLTGFYAIGCLDLPAPTELDLTPGDGRQLDLTVDPATGKITGDATGKLGEVITVKGTKHARGSVQLQITYED